MASWLHQRSPALVRICEICTRNTADFFCECSGSKKYFCSSHFSDHTTKHPGLLHSLVRADVDASEVPGIQARTEALAAGRAELLQSLSAIDQCRTELESVVQRLTEYLRDQLTQLDTLKATLAADIEDSVGEVESTLAMQKVRFLGKYSAFLRSHVPGSLLLFHYQIDQGIIKSYSSRLLKYTLKNPTAERSVRSRERSEEQKVIAVETEDETDTIKPFDGASVSGWTCKRCKKKNEKTASYCSTCRSNRTEDKWICKFCQEVNRATTTQCGLCYRSRNAEPVETLKKTCAKCGMRTFGVTQLCTFCEVKTSSANTEPLALSKCVTCGRVSRSDVSECSYCLEREASRKCRQCGQTVTTQDGEYCAMCYQLSGLRIWICLKCDIPNIHTVCRVCREPKLPWQ